jgi:hypothetical protein
VHVRDAERRECDTAVAADAALRAAPTALGSVLACILFGTSAELDAPSSGEILA